MALNAEELSEPSGSAKLREAIGVQREHEGTDLFPAGIVAGTGDGQAQQARFGADGALYCVRDDDGFANVYRNDEPVVREPFEHAEATWGPGQRSFAISPDGTRLVYNRNESGFGRLVVVDLAKTDEQRQAQVELERKQAEYCKVHYEDAKTRGDETAVNAEGPLGPCRPSVLTAIKKWNASDSE